ncbi:MAG: hypothetical protein IPI01_20755 [Ignavibacteriae bacterium]|nr:hypothetical protein [Ignavibacteriota bacterium]
MKQGRRRRTLPLHRQQWRRRYAQRGSAADRGDSAAPTILFNPVDQLVGVGRPATFTVRVQGAPPISFQWQKNGAPINGATGLRLHHSGNDPRRQRVGVPVCREEHSRQHLQRRSEVKKVTTGQSLPSLRMQVLNRERHRGRSIRMGAPRSPAAPGKPDGTTCRSRGGRNGKATTCNWHQTGVTLRSRCAMQVVLPKCVARPAMMSP